MIPATGYISETCRLYIAVLFLFSAGGKALSFREFEKTVTESMSFPPWGSRYIAGAVIVAEALGAFLSLMSGTAARLGVSLALFLSLIFAGFVTTMLVQGKSVRCNCFGQTNESLSSLDLLRNGFMIAACVFYLLSISSGIHTTIAYLLLLAMAVIALL